MTGTSKREVYTKDLKKKKRKKKKNKNLKKHFKELEKEQIPKLVEGNKD